MNKAVENPCFNCSVRSAECHSSCEAYKSFRAFKDKQLAEADRERIVYCAIYELDRDRNKRKHNARRRGKKL